MRAAAAALAVAVGWGGAVLAANGGPSPFLTRPGIPPPGERTLPEGEGRAEVEAICSGCHSLQMVTQQRLPRERWDYLLNWMVAEQGMAELDPATRTLVLDYLSTHLSP